MKETSGNDGSRQVLGNGIPHEILVKMVKKVQHEATPLTSYPSLFPKKLSQLQKSFSQNTSRWLT